MNNNSVLKRQGYEHISVFLSIPLMIFVVYLEISHRGLTARLISLSFIVFLFCHLAWIELTKPDAMIKDAELHLFDVWVAKTYYHSDS